MGKTRDLFKKIRNTNQENISWKCKHNKEQKQYGKKILRRDGKNTQKSYTKKILMARIILMVWTLT